MNFIVEIKMEHYDEFVSKHPHCHYMKTSSWASYKADCEELKPHYVGVIKNNKLAATALLLQKKTSFINYFYIPWGFCCDYADIELLHFFLQAIKNYVRSSDADFLKVDFNVERIHHNLDGTLLNDDFSNEFVTTTLLSEGFTHKGYGYAYNGSWVNRFTLIIDISKSLDEIISGLDKRKQVHIKNLPTQGLSTRIGNREDLKYVALFEKHLSVKQGFKPKSISYFEKIIDHLQDKAVIYITEFNINQYLSGIEELLKTKKYKVDKLAAEIKLREYDQALQWKNLYGESVVVAAGIFARIHTQAWDLYIYNNKHFPMLHSCDSLHIFAIQDMQKHGVLYYDMVGFSGVVDKSDAYYGLYKYKSSFNPRFVEYIGEFDYIINEKAYHNFINIKHLLSRTKRKLNRLIHKKKTLT